MTKAEQSTKALAEDNDDGLHQQSRELAAERCRTTLAIVLGGLFAQFLLGIYLNLYVIHLHGQPPLVAHIVLGTALVVGGIIGLATALQSRRADHIFTAALGLVALVLAWAGGLRFLRAGSHSTDSFLMAIGFVCAVAALTGGLMMIYRRPLVERLAR